MTRIVALGVDPGCITAGYSVIGYDTATRQTQLLAHGVCSMAASAPLFRRVGSFHRFFREKIEEHGVTLIALETPFLGKNAQNFLKLGYMRGILYLLCDAYQLEPHEFAPSQVKLAVTGYGGASKEQVARLLMQLFPALAFPQKFDATDAIAVSLCGVWKNSFRSQNLIGR